MSKRISVSFIYFSVVLMTLLLRVSSSLGVYDTLQLDGDAFFTCVVQLLIFGIMPLALYFICTLRALHKPWLILKQDFGFKKTGGKNWLRIFVIAICMTTSASLVSYVWGMLLSAIGYTSVSSSTEYSSIGVLIGQIVLVAVLPAFFEEFTHRGLIYAGYRETGWKFVLISALLFSLMHQNIRQTGYTFYDGIILALVMYYTGSLWGGVFVHFFNNLVSVLQDYVVQNGGFLDFFIKIRTWLFASAAGFFVYLFIALMCMAVMFIMFWRMRRDGVDRGIIPSEPFMSAGESVLPLRKDVMLWATIILGVAATVFSLVWGILR